MSQPPAAPRRISPSRSSADRTVRRLAGTGRRSRSKYAGQSSSRKASAASRPSAAASEQKTARWKTGRGARARRVKCILSGIRRDRSQCRSNERNPCVSWLYDGLGVWRRAASQINRAASFVGFPGESGSGAGVVPVVRVGESGLRRGRRPRRPGRRAGGGRPPGHPACRWRHRRPAGSGTPRRVPAGGGFGRWRRRGRRWPGRDARRWPAARRRAETETCGPAGRSPVRCAIVLTNPLFERASALCRPQRVVTGNRGRSSATLLGRRRCRPSERCTGRVPRSRSHTVRLRRPRTPADLPVPRIPGELALGHIHGPAGLQH